MTDRPDVNHLPEEQRKAIFKALVEALKDLDGSREPQFHEYSVISSRLKERKIDLRSVGYSQFKKFIQAADLRGLVETRTEGVNNYAKLNVS